MYCLLLAVALQAVLSGNDSHYRPLGNLARLLVCAWQKAGQCRWDKGVLLVLSPLLLLNIITAYLQDRLKAIGTAKAMSMLR